MSKFRNIFYVNAYRLLHMMVRLKFPASKITFGFIKPKIFMEAVIENKRQLYKTVRNVKNEQTRRNRDLKIDNDFFNRLEYQMMIICRLQPKNSLNGGWFKLYPVLKSNMVSLTCVQYIKE